MSGIHKAGTAAHLNAHGQHITKLFACAARLHEGFDVKVDARLTALRNGHAQGNELFFLKAKNAIS